MMRSMTSSMPERVAEVVKRASPDDAFQCLLADASQVGVLAEMLNGAEAFNFLSSLHKRGDCGFADIFDRGETETDGACAPSSGRCRWRS